MEYCGANVELISVVFNNVQLGLQEEYGITAPVDRPPSEIYKLPTGLPPPQLIKLNHDYCFSHGRHSGSFYLKLGAAGKILDFKRMVLESRLRETT